jgi:hypothetical protein
MRALIVSILVIGMVAAAEYYTPLQRDGQALFPIGFYELPEDEAGLQAMADAGVNLVRVGDRARLDRLEAQGMFGVVPLPLQARATKGLRATTASVVDHPALALWEGPDEIVWTFTAYSGLYRTMGIHQTRDAWKNQSPEAVAYAREQAAVIMPNMQEAAALIRELDPRDRPLWINEAQDSDVFYVRQYLDFVDITGCDLYPVKPDDRRVWRMAGATERWKQIGRGKPVWMVMQAFSWNELGEYYNVQEVAYPTFDESRFMAWDVITHGASGILYWGSHALKSEPFRQSVYAVTSELAAVQPFLVAPDVPIEIQVIDLPADQGERGVHGIARRAGDDWLVALVNEDEVRHLGVVVHGLEELNGRDMLLLYGEERVPVAHGELIVRMQPLEVKVYATSRAWESERREGRAFE